MGLAHDCRLLMSLAALEVHDCRRAMRLVASEAPNCRSASRLVVSVDRGCRRVLRSATTGRLRKRSYWQLAVDLVAAAERWQLTSI